MHIRFDILNKNHMKHQFGFTLAEVLFTITVIGVVAALTIPSLIQSVSNKQYETSLKKNYSVIANAYKALESDGINMEHAYREQIVVLLH